MSALNAVDPTVLNPGPDVTIDPAPVRYVEARHLETVVRGRPWVPFRRIATVSKGTKFVVRGTVQSRNDKGCKGKPWYAVLPRGYVCSIHVRETQDPPTSGIALPLTEGRRLPHAYAVVRRDGVPSYKNRDAVLAGLPDRSLTKSMSLVVRRKLTIEGVPYVETQYGNLVPKQGVGWMGQGSGWQGIVVDGAQVGPLFAWARRDKTQVRNSPDPSAAVVQSLAHRDRVPLLEIKGSWRRIGPSAWVEQRDLNEVHVIDPPDGVLTEFREGTVGNDQWIDVDVGEQVLVAYRGPTPVYTTIVSSGRGSPTPLGNYPIWAKVASMDMANQDYEDKPYMVQGVPWVLLFQAHNALHGAYWHDRFGNRKSHGCVNLAPRDARWVFNWTAPTLPVGWTGYLPDDLQKGVVVHVRDTSRAPDEQFTQQRPWGPPDREAERLKSEAAAERRAQQEAEEAAKLAEEAARAAIFGLPYRPTPAATHKAPTPSPPPRLSPPPVRVLRQ